ncbi:MAG: bifunctional RNase H/acid phosphatase [Actinomycetota bacterium]|nr:MAG: bifunctional RNase H/acid phosphatase [Actinomycetota bacterium]
MGRSFVVEADGGSRGNPGPAAYGALVRDAGTGQVLVEVAGFLGVATNNVAEYSGLVAGLVEAVALDAAAAVEVRMDSKLVIEQMSGRWSIKHPAMRELATRARKLISARQVTFTWVPRKANSAADALVNESLDAVQRGESGQLRRTPGSPPAPPPQRPDGPAAVAEAAATGTASATGDQVRPPDRFTGWRAAWPPTTTLLLRHGASPMSLARQFSGSGGTDPALAPVGVAQAVAAAADLVARGGADVVVASPLRRTRQTAEVVAAELGASVDLVEDLRECAFGQWDGFTFAEVQERWPQQLTAWLASTDVAPPGGESVAEVATRVAAALATVIDRYRGKRIVVVAHVTPIKVAVATALDAPLHSLFRMELAPCSISTVAWWQDGTSTLLGYAEAAHLRGVESAEDA